MVNHLPEERTVHAPDADRGLHAIPRPFRFILSKTVGRPTRSLQFLSRGPGYTVFLTGHSTVLALRKVAAAPAGPERKGAQRSASDVKVTTASVWMTLLGARSDPQIEGIDPLPGRVNYFIGNDSTKWHTDIPTYARVKYRSVYPGIDLIYYGTPRSVGIRPDCGSGRGPWNDPDRTPGRRPDPR